jgi:transcriptional regulator with XRE-family HTH domain
VIREQWLSQFGAAVRAARIECGWSQSELADRMRVSRSSVANFEAGRQDMPSSSAAHLISLLRVEIPGWSLDPSEDGSARSAMAELVTIRGKLDAIRAVLD